MNYSKGAHETIAERDVRTLMHPASDLSRHAEVGPIIMERGEGVYIYDAEGGRYLDAMAALWCASLGYSEMRLVEAARKQMERLPFYHIGRHRSNVPAINLADALLAIAPKGLEKVLFATSGSEANEQAVKLMWFYHNAIGKLRKKKVISRVRGTHGATIFAASMTGSLASHVGWDLPLAGVLHTDCPSHYIYGLPGESEAQYVDRIVGNLEQLIHQEGPETIGAFIAEPVIGGGGIIVPPRGYFEKVQKILKQYDILFIADELVCGFGRTGCMFGCDTFGIQPDFMTVGKALSAGYLPISATLVSGKVYEAVAAYSARLGDFAHSFTYAGHPTAAAVALETLKIYQERDIVSVVRKAATYFQERMRAFRDHPIVGEVRGVGLIGALQLVKDKANRTSFIAEDGVGAVVQEAARKAGVILRVVPEAVQLCPPLIISPSEVDELFDALKVGLDAGAQHARWAGL